MKIAFVGTGMIGSGLAVNAVMHGNDVRMYYRRNFEKLESSVKKTLSVFVEAGFATQQQADDWFNAIHFTMDLSEAVKGADLVQESIAERLDMKKDMYHAIQEICGKEVVIASSTSAIFPSALSEGALYPENIVVGHPYNPSYLLPIMEVCGPQASQDTIDKVFAVYKAMGKEPLLCKKEVNGFIVNSLSWAVMDGAIKAVMDGVCSVEDVDKALIYGPGMRMAVTGQLLTMSLGVDGGFRMMGAKYGGDNDSPEAKAKQVVFEHIADGVDQEISNRDGSIGNTVEDVIKFRDKTFIELLKLQNKI